MMVLLFTISKMDNQVIEKMQERLLGRFVVEDVYDPRN